jgi:hypothetical protein
VKQLINGHMFKGGFVFLFKLVLVTIIALVLWNLVLSNLYLRRPLSFTHPVLGRIYAEGLYVQGKEGYGRAHIDALGLRILPTFATEETAKQVLLFGDSYTLGMQVTDEHTFAWLLQERLGKSYKVINAGREGASPNYYIGLSEFYKETFKPDIVVIQLSETDFTHDPFDKQQSLYYTKTDQSFELQRNEAYKSRSFIGKNFDALKEFFNFSVMRIALEKLDGEHNRGDEFRAADTRSAAEQQADQAAFISFAVKELKAIYGDPIIVYIPLIDYYSTTYTEPSIIEQVLSQAVEKTGTRYISMRDDFVSYFQQEHRMPQGFANTKPGTGHINELGHALVAERLSQIIAK